jgi:hypothetical protein
MADALIEAARDNPSVAALRTLIPQLLYELGRVDEARARLDAEVAGGFDLPYDATWLAGMANLTDAAASTGSRDAARALIGQLEAYETQVVSAAGALVLGAIARPLARAASVLSEYQQAERWFAIAHDIHVRLQAPYWTALGQLDHAELCLARRSDGDLERARQLATTAAATAAEYGCASLTTRAAALLVNL